MKKFVSYLLIIFLVSALYTGCTYRVTDFTVISTRNVNVAGARGERVEGRDSGFWMAYIPIVRPNLKEALDEAIEKGNGDCLMDGVVYRYFYFFLFFSIDGYKVVGTVVNTREVAESQ